MKDRSLSLELHPITLENAGEGVLSEAFDRCVGEAAAIFQDHEHYVVKDGRIKVKIVAEVELTYDIQVGALEVDTRCETRVPKARPQRTLARFTNDGQILVEPNRQELLPLQPNNLKSINGD